MELKAFVKTTLRELSKGVSESKEELGKKVSLTNTTLRRVSHGDYGLIEFDLAVEAKSTQSGSKQGGFQIKILDANLSKSKEATSGSISRVKFVIEADF